MKRKIDIISDFKRVAEDKSLVKYTIKDYLKEKKMFEENIKVYEELNRNLEISDEKFQKKFNI